MSALRGLLRRIDGNDGGLIDRSHVATGGENADEKQDQEADQDDHARGRKPRARPAASVLCDGADARLSARARPGAVFA